MWDWSFSFCVPRNVDVSIPIFGQAVSRASRISHALIGELYANLLLHPMRFGLSFWIDYSQLSTCTPNFLCATFHPLERVSQPTGLNSHR
jgi:hypothetical protein